MKTVKNLNAVTFDNFCEGFETTFKKIKVVYQNGYCNLFYDGKSINTFMPSVSSLAELKKSIRYFVNLHCVDFLKNQSVAFLKKEFSEKGVNKIMSYCFLSHALKIKSYKNKNDVVYLMNEIKNYFIFRLCKNN